MRPFRRGSGGDEGGGGGGEDRKRDDFGGPPGDYIIALTWFTRREAKSGGDYIRCRFVVAAGPAKGQGFYCAVSLDDSKVGARRRLELWMEAVGCDDEIDLDSDKSLAAAFKGKAFKATLSRTEARGDDGRVWINYDIERLVYPRLYTERDCAAVEAWNAEWSSNWQRTDPAGGGSRSRSDEAPHEEPAWTPGSGLAGSDEDIPF